ncbi:hypothetical protein [Stenotrophomonas humi]
MQQLRGVVAGIFNLNECDDLLGHDTTVVKVVPTCEAGHVENVVAGSVDDLNRRGLCCTGFRRCVIARPGELIVWNA